MAGKILCGDCRDILATLPEKSVQCVVTSPPYWGLRDYGHTDQLGLEQTPAEYVERMVEVFRGVHRVLRDDGVLWLNLGDTYVSNPGDRHKVGGFQAHPADDRAEAESAMGFNKHRSGLKPKDLVGIPWRVALALQEDGWYLRADVIWAKGCSGNYRGGAVMPESVEDRPTKAHEYVFLLSKSARYFYDAHAVKEPSTYAGKNTGACGAKFAGKAGYETHVSGSRDIAATRNLRSVWVVGTRGFKGAHFAVFPPDLVRPCIQAGTSEYGCCTACGAPYKRVLEKGAVLSTGGSATGARAQNMGCVSVRGQEPKSAYNTGVFQAHEWYTTGWKPTCSCGVAERRPCTVLDPFFGAGTTGLVAESLGLEYVGIEINPEYADLAAGRIQELRDRQGYLFEEGLVK